MRMKFLLALLAFAALATAVLFGPAGFQHRPQSAEATSLNEIKKLLTSDAQAAASYFAGRIGTTAVRLAVFVSGRGSPVPSTRSIWLFDSNRWWTHRRSA